jgi:CDP-diacylglycerol--glycerol-3-phosphate 3-phosphatidyltransferase
MEKQTQSETQQNTQPDKSPNYVRSLATKIFSEPIARLRDLIAVKLLVRSGITPNMLTVAGTLFSIIGAGFLAIGAEQTWDQEKIPYPFYAALFFFLSSAMDMLDGALARLGNLKTNFGGILDSCLDRVSDMAIFGGLALAYARLGNQTFVFLCILATVNAVMISYIKARAECELPASTVGFWQRGERMAGILIASFAANINTLVWMMALLPAFSAAYRLYFCYKQTQDREFKIPAPKSPLQFWRYRRGAWPFVVPTATYILILMFVKLPAPDFLAKLFNP